MADLIDRDALMKEICGNECGSVCDEECEKVMCNYYDYIMDAPAVNRWIPCSERFPDNGVAVLVYTGENNFKVWLAEYSKYMEVWTLAGNYILIKKNAITHWMPLPEPPEKE